MPYKYRKKL